MPARLGSIDRGHPYVKIVVSADGNKLSAPFVALIDTGFSDFISLPLIQAVQLGLVPHTTTRYILANGKASDPVPLATGFACVEGDQLVRGLISISEMASSPLVGVTFLQACRKGLLILSTGVWLLDEDEIAAAQQNTQTQKPKP
jgi:predicted aspartyl protease